MHLDQMEQRENVMQQGGEAAIEMDPPFHFFDFFPQPSFLHHYASVQEITEVQGPNCTKQSSFNISKASNQVDYIDQFLWSSAPNEDSPRFGDNVNQTTTLMQKQNDNNFILQSQTPHNPKQDQNPQPKQTRPTHTPKNRLKDGLSKDYRKNLAGYILKKVIRIMTSPEYRKKLERSCCKRGVSLETLIEYCSESLPKLFGPNSIYELFLVTDQSQRNMKELLRVESSKILRRQYTLSILKDGRMRDFDAYIEIKNKGLLYFQQLMP